MNSKVLNIIENLKGSLLAIGLFEENLLDAIEKNDNIETCYLLNKISLTSKKFSMTKRGKNKKINIKKIKKQFKKKSLNNIICNYNIIKQFYRSFIPNSIYLTNKKIYIYGQREDLKKITSKYQRYTNKIKIEKVDEEYLMEIDTSNTKNSFFKDLIYKIKDFSSDFVDILTDILINWKEVVVCIIKKNSISLCQN